MIDFITDERQRVSEIQNRLEGELDEIRMVNEFLNRKNDLIEVQLQLARTM